VLRGAAGLRELQHRCQCPADCCLLPLLQWQSCHHHHHHQSVLLLLLQMQLVPPPHSCI